MAGLQVRIYGDTILRKKAKIVRNIDDELRHLIKQMAETMRASQIGVGLAAPQVGRLVRVAIVREDADDDVPIHCLINPRLVEQEEEQTGSEGCLSFPTLRADVQRPLRVLVEALNPDGDEIHLEAEGLLARVLAHEIDHLNGVLFIDRAERDSLGWLIPDEDADDGYRIESTSLDQVHRKLDRLRQETE